MVGFLLIPMAPVKVVQYIQSWCLNRKLQSIVNENSSPEHPDVSARLTNSSEENHVNCHVALLSCLVQPTLQLFQDTSDLYIRRHPLDQLRKIIPTNMSSSVDLTNSTILSRASTISALSFSEKLHILLDSLESLELEASFDRDHYNHLIQDLVANLSHVGSVGKLFEQQIEHRVLLRFVDTKSLSFEFAERVITKSPALRFIWKTNDSLMREGGEEYILRSITIWYFYTLFRNEYANLMNQTDSDLDNECIGLFMSLGFHLAAMLQPNTPMSSGMLLELSIIEPIVEVGLAFYMTPESQSKSFLIMICAVIVSHISVPILNDSLLRSLAISRDGSNLHQKLTTLFEASVSSSETPPVTNKPGILEIISNMRLLPMIHTNTWSLEAHFVSVFESVWPSYYILMTLEQLAQSKQTNQHLQLLLENYHPPINQEQLGDCLDVVITSFTSLSKRDMMVIECGNLPTLKNIARVISSGPSLAIIEKCKTVGEMIREKRFQHFYDIDTGSNVDALAKLIGISPEMRAGQLPSHLLEILFELVGDADNVLGNAGFTSLFYLTVRILEKSTQTMEGIEAFIWTLSSMNNTQSAVALLSHVIYRVGRFILKDLGQPTDDTFEAFFERAVPMLTLGKHGDSPTNTKTASILSQITSRNELMSCMQLLVISFYRVTYMRSLVLPPNNSVIALMRKDELKMVTGALMMAYDLAIIPYPSTVGSPTLRNITQETFCFVAKEYQSAGSVLDLLSDAAAMNVKYKFLSKAIAKSTGVTCDFEPTMSMGAMSQDLVALNLADYAAYLEPR